MDCKVGLLILKGDWEWMSHVVHSSWERMRNADNQTVDTYDHNLQEVNIPRLTFRHQKYPSSVPLGLVTSKCTCRTPVGELVNIGFIAALMSIRLYDR